MKKILEINDEDVGHEIRKDVKYKPRTAARAIIFDGDKIALLNVTKHNFYKLPGGGVDDGEIIEDALTREILEEVGCTVDVIKEIGEILEHRSQWGLVQTSHCYLADIMKKGKPSFTEKEISEGFELVWVSLDEAIKLVGNSKPDSYHGNFVIARDLEFLRRARRMR
jgi:8-oxo-dGTP pyrophosphatase MutT (NUDIX family)